MKNDNASHRSYRTYTSYKTYFWMMFFLLLLSLACTALASDEDVNIARIQKAYEGIKDIRGSFVQKSVIKDLNKTETYRGEFFIKRPMKMKWVYGGKTAQDLTINGDTVLIYKKGDKQAYRNRFDRQTYGQTPVALLSGFGNVKEEFDVSGKGNTLVLKPKKPMGNVTTIKVVLSEGGFPIRSFVISDTRGNVVEIELKDVKTNTGLKDSLFTLALPKGVSVFEQ
jgi:outer membrane lipoprotein carrier protein